MSQYRGNCASDSEQVDTDLDLAAAHSAEERLLTDLEWAETTEVEATEAEATEVDADVEPEMDDDTDGIDETGSRDGEEEPDDNDGQRHHEDRVDEERGFSDEGGLEPIMEQS